jgi:hypothetical protein
MKVRISLTIDESIVGKVKQYAANKQVSVSELVESHFKGLTRSVNQKNIIQLVEGLKKTFDSPWKRLEKRVLRRSLLKLNSKNPSFCEMAV